MGSAAFAVTTRSRLKGVRFFPSMFVASWRIKRQLKHTSGCVRFASIVASPREFWTISCWESRDRMLEFMRSGAHEEMMWRLGKWLRSFWLMRWSPTPLEQGRWGAGTLAAPRAETPTEPGPAQPDEALSAALNSMPRLKASTGPRGAPTYESAPMTRRSKKAVEGGAAVVARIGVPWPHRLRAAGRDIRRLSRRLEDYEGALRWVSGLGNLRSRYLMVVLSDEDACQRFLADPLHEELQDRWGPAYWAMAWEAANEFGHWDGFRLRQQRSRYAVDVPKHAEHLE